MLKITDLTTDYRNRPVGLDVSPRFGWKLQSDRKGVLQISYRITAIDSDTKQQIWDSGVVMSSQSFGIAWNGESLHSFEKIHWQVVVSVKDEENQLEENRSETAYFEMGILYQEEWKCAWIEPEDEVEIDGRMPAPYLRKVFSVKPGLKEARIYQTAHGLYEYWINGETGTEEKFKPGFTSYYKRLQYQTYDITSLLNEGRNCWAVALGDGWWRGNTGGAFRNNFGYKLGYFGQIRIVYENGTVEYISTDSSFKTLNGEIRKNDMKEGEYIDASKEPVGWKTSNYDDTQWKRIHLEQDEFATLTNLVSSRSIPVHEKEKFMPQLMHTPDGNTVLDFGQNIAGYVQVHFHGLKNGQIVEMKHGEALDENGNFTQKNIILDNPEAEIQKVTYVSDGSEDVYYKPTFAVFGFQYVLVKGLENIDINDFTAIAVYSDMGETGSFKCSNKLINQLVSNSIWSQKGNFLDVPTDCPTRERSPWTGDSQVYAETASRFMNVYGFFEKWMIDVSLEQFESGKIPNTAPRSAAVHNTKELERKKKKMESLPEGSVLKLALQMTLGTPENGGAIEGSAGWGDAAVINPYTMYLCYGDKTILENQYNSAKHWVDYEIREAAKISKVYQDMPWYSVDNHEDAKYIWDVDFHFGEWCEPDAKSGDPMETMKLYYHPDYKTATMYLFYSSSLLSKIAEILGYYDDSISYSKYSEKVKQVYNKYFISEKGKITEGRQAPNVRALYFNLADENHKKAVAEYLAELIHKNDYHLNTGFLATPYLLPMLVENGYSEEAFRVLEQTECPGWLYNVKCGATTILENWDGYQKCQNSFNHYSYGAVCNFLFEYVAGIRPLIEHPGYREFELRPVIGGDLTSAEAVQDTFYGVIKSAWQKERDGSFTYHFTVPANTTAHVYLKSNSKTIKKTLGSGEYTLRENEI